MLTVTHQRRLTEAHKPGVPREKSRIEQAGGAVINRNGTQRVGGLGMRLAL
jgi:hypothetical protein